MKKPGNYLPFIILFLLPVLIYPLIQSSVWTSSSDIHAMLEFSSALLAFTAGVMVLIHFFITGRRFFLIISCGFVLIGTIEVVHALFSLDRMWSYVHPTFESAISSTWLTGNLVLLMAFLAALISREKEIPNSSRTLYAIIFNVISFILSASIALLIFYSTALPGFVRLGSRAKEIIELSLAFLYFCTFLAYLRSSLKQQSISPLMWNMLAFFIVRIWAHIFIFNSSYFYDAHWDASHLIVLLSYFFPIFGVWGETIKLHSYSQLQVTELAKAMDEQKKYSEAINETEENFRLIFENNSAAMALMEPDSTISNVNEKFCSLSGYTKQEAIGMSGSRYIPCEYLDRVNESDGEKQIYPNDDPNKYEFTFYKKNGEIRYALSSFAILKNKKIIASFVDITERKRIEEELKESEDKYSKAFLTSPYGIILTSEEDGQFIDVNDAFTAITGYTRLEAISDSTVSNNLWVDNKNRRDMIKSLLLGMEVVGKEVLFRKKNGDIILGLLSSGIIHIKGKPIILSSINDITKRKEVEKTLKAKMDELIILNKELEQYIYANQELKQFAYTASHQLQEPIRTVSNYTQIIEEDYSALLDKSGLKYLHTIRDATNRMAKLIDSLMEFSRLGRNKKLIRCDCKQLIDTVISDLETLIKTSGASIEVYEMPVLNLYEVEIHQLFQNLITNAIKFRKKETQPRILIKSRKLNNLWEFSFSDNGIGIAPEHFTRIFDIFQRLHANEDEYEGSGIGLAYCKKIVQLHYGDIWIESVKGSGSTFYFTLSDNLT